METVYKGYIVKSDKAFPSLLTVATSGRGGKIPAVLEGLFTSFGDVKQRIDSYVEGKDADKEKHQS